MKGISHILVATDFSPVSECALDTGLDLANQFHAKLTLVHALEAPAYAFPFPVAEEVLQAAQALLDAAVDAARARVPAADGVLQEGVAWEEILSTAEDVGADLVIVGSHGRRGLSRLLLGSVAERVIRMSPVPVLTIRGRESSSSRGVE